MDKFEEEKNNLQEGAEAIGSIDQALKNAIITSARLLEETRSLTEELKDQL